MSKYANKFDLIRAIHESTRDTPSSIVTEAKASGYDDEHAFVNVWNHSVHNPKLLKSKASLHADIDSAKTDKKHPLHFDNQTNGFTGGKKQEHRDAYYSELHHAADSVHDIANHPAFADSVKNKHEASVAGASRGSLSKTWVQHGAKNTTSKADVTIGSGKHLKTLSLKKGDAQLMSAGKEETSATYDHAMQGMVAHGHATPAQHLEVMKHMKTVSSHIAAMKTAKNADEQIAHKNKAQDIINKIHKDHPKLIRYVTHEAATGHGKFGTHGSGTARFLVTTGKGGAHVHDSETNDVGHESTLPIPRVALPKGSGREGNVKLDYKGSKHFK